MFLGGDRQLNLGGVGLVIILHRAQVGAGKTGEIRDKLLVIPTELRKPY